MSASLRAAVAGAVVAASVVPSLLADNASTPPRLPGKVGVTQKLGAQIPLDDMFRDESGKIVRLGDYFRSGRPVLLDFMYYGCPMLCPVNLEGTASALTELKFDIGKDFDVITVSIDPRDMPEAASEKKEKYVKRYGRPGAYVGWHFLTGPDMAIRRLTNAVGFDYAYDPQMNQFAHGTALIVVTPQGRVSKYLYGFEYKPRDIRLGLVEASAGTIGTATDQFLLLCYHYDARTGKYTRTAMNVVRAGGIATVAALAGFIFVMVRSEQRQSGIPSENDKRRCLLIFRCSPSRLRPSPAASMRSSSSSPS